MSRMLERALALAVLAIAMAGCASGPPPTPLSEMTYSEAVAERGQPQSYTRISGDLFLAQWIDEDVCGVCSRPSGTIEHLAVLYDRSGRFVRIEHRYRDSW